MGHLMNGKKKLLDGKQKRTVEVTSDDVASQPEHHACGLTRYEGMPAFGVLQHAAKIIPNRVAIRYGEQVWSYAELDNDAQRCAAMLQRIGVEPGDRVGILLPNVPEYVIAANGIWRAGGVAIAISPLMVAEEVEKLLRNTDCHHVISLDVLSHLVGEQDEHGRPIRSLMVSIRQHLPALHQLGYLWARHSRTGSWTLPTTDNCRWFWDEIEKTDRVWQPISIDPSRDAAYILPTGGTTGAPKAVTLSHRNMVANAWQQYEWTDRSFGEETMLAVLPFFHSYGMSATIMSGAMMGATLILHHRFNTRQVIRLIEQQRPTVFHAVPAMLVAMNERLRSHPADLSSVRWVISGGAPLEESVGSEFSEHSGALVVEGYGLSEASPVTHVGHLFDQARYGTIGLTLPDTECRLIDSESGNEVADGEVGELVVRGPQVMLGYWNDKAATETAIRDGWLHTGDLATRGEDGYYAIVGRIKDLIITSGYNVYPSEVEAVIREADDVMDAAVVSHPDERRGEVVKAIIVLKAGAKWDEEKLREHCGEHLSKYKRPRIFELCEGDLPRNFLGKVIRRHLREPAAGTDAAENEQTQEVK